MRAFYDIQTTNSHLAIHQQQQQQQQHFIYIRTSTTSLPLPYSPTSASPHDLYLSLFVFSLSFFSLSRFIELLFEQEQSHECKYNVDIWALGQQDV